MQLNTKAIVFSALKYGESSLIVKAFTESSGLKSYMLKGVLASKKGKLKPAYFLPLTQLDMVVSHRDKGNLERIKEVRLLYHYQTLHTQFVKNSISLFLAEMLVNSIHEEEENIGLYQFLETAFQWLDTHTDIANFHLGFLMELTKYLGCYPDYSSSDLPYFDLLEGCFVSKETVNPIIKGEKLKVFKTFIGTNFDAIDKVKLSKKQRQELLANLMLYYGLHLHGFRKPKSLDVLKEVFN